MASTKTHKLITTSSILKRAKYFGYPSSEDREILERELEKARLYSGRIGIFGKVVYDDYGDRVRKLHTFERVGRDHWRESVTLVDADG